MWTKLLKLRQLLTNNSHKYDFCDSVNNRDIKYSSVFIHGIYNLLCITAVISVTSRKGFRLIKNRIS